jgi:hypothetical protein
MLMRATEDMLPAFRLSIVLGVACFGSLSGLAQTTVTPPVPIAIIPVEGVELTGAISVAEGKAMIGVSGTVTAGEHAATVTLPHRGNLRVCATTKVTLTADSGASIRSAPVAEGSDPATGATAPAGLMMALDRGALEANFATGQNSDVILTPDFRILISGPGIAAVRVRLGPQGDTCVDNQGPNAPYVTVSSVFEGGVYRVQPGQRVMFQRGRLNEVVDDEKESCGCPAEPVAAGGNEFPVAQSAGLTARPAPIANPGAGAGNSASEPKVTAELNARQASEHAATPVEAKAQPAVEPATAEHDSNPDPAKTAAQPAKKDSVFSRIGRFFRKLFGG